MQKKFLKIVIILLLLLCTFTITSKSEAATATPTYPYDLIWNIESYYYYLDSSATKYATQIANAANNWVYTGYGWNNLYPNTKTTKIIDSACDFFGYSEVDNTNAYTTFFKRSNGHSGTVSSANPYSSNWLFNEIYLNYFYMDEYSSTTKQGVIAHEFGHAFGLDHNDTNSNSIMCSMSHGRAVYKVQQVDQNAFNAKHP